MGNKQAKPGLVHGSEMSSAQQFERVEDGSSDPLCALSELELDSQSLRDSVQILSFAIDEIFEEEEEPGEPHEALEAKLLGMTRLNQGLILKLITQLERHAKQVGAGREQNERVMTLVRTLVDTVNRYMAMLCLNIRKLKRLVSEMDNPPSTVNMYRTDNAYHKGRRALYLPQKQGVSNPRDLVHDVISDQQDVDAMLLELINTREQREEIEADMVTVLVFWRDYTYIRARESDSGVIGKIEENVLAAADHITAGVPRLQRKLT